MNNTCKFRDFSLPNAPFQYAPDFQLVPDHMEIHLSFDIKNKSIKGSNTISISSSVDDANTIKLDAVDFEKVEVIGDDINWIYDGNRINITFENPFTKNEQREVKIQYQVIQPVAGLYFSYPDEDYPNRATYVASDHETDRARHWVPCVDHPSVRTTFDWYLRAKSDYTILAIGDKISEEEDGEYKIVHWKHNYPCPIYIAAIAIGKFVEYKDRDVETGDSKIPVVYYTTDDYSADNLKLSFDRTPDMIEWFESKFDMPIPWPKYYQFALKDLGGAMENQSLVSWGDYAILNEETYREYAQNIDETNVHELAHTFFGDMVVIRDWGHAWLKESWATYISALWLEDTKSVNDFKYDMYKNAQSYFNEVDTKYTRPIVNRKFHSAWEMFDSHLYPGGAWRLHMLRNLLGDETFFTAVKDYLKTYAGNTVETIDFVRKLEQHSGKSLSRFFDQWIFEAKGYPHLKIKFDFNADKNQGTFTIIQKQVKENKDEIKHKPFEIKLDLGWFDEKLNIETIKLSRKKHQFTYSLTNKPKYVRIDPYDKLLIKVDLDYSDVYLKNLLSSPDMIARIRAGKHLAKTGKRKNIKAVGKQLEDESFYGVRAELVKALVKSNSRFAIPYLINSLELENDPRIQRVIAKTIGKLKDEKIEQALIEFLQRDIGPYTKASGLKALAGQRTDRAEEIIKDYLKDKGWKYILRKAAFQSLSELREKEYIDFLVEKSNYGKEVEQVRNAIVSSLASLSSWFEKLEKKKAEEQLIKLLRDPDQTIQLQAARGLGRLKSRSAISSLKQLKGMFPKQDRVVIDKLIKKIRKASQTDNLVSDFKEKLEKLEEKLQKLDEKVRKLEEKPPKH